MNWRKGFFRGWLLISILWIFGVGVVLWPDAAKKIELARMSDKQLLSVLYPECKEIPDLPKGFILDTCAEALQKAGRNPFEVFDVADLRRWGGGDGYIEQVIRVIKATVSLVPILLGPPLFLLLLGVGIGWVLIGFKTKRS
jgi:hypothetical protein